MRALILAGLMATPFYSAPAFAENLSACEIVLMERIEDEKGGGVDVASYRPASIFMASVYDDSREILTEVDGHPIRAVLCTRNDVLPQDTDYPILATGIPFVISQDFDSSDTDSLTVFYQNGAFQHVYKGYPMSAETSEILETRLEGFSEQATHLAEKEAAAKADMDEALTDNMIDASEADMMSEEIAEEMPEVNQETDSDTDAERLSLEDSRSFR